MQQVRDRQAGPLPLASPPDRTDVIYGFGRIDASGRVADRVIISALGWRGGDRLTLTAGSGVMVARRDPGGMVTVPARPYIVIPAAVRRRCGLLAGDRVSAGKFAERARRHHAMVHELLAEGHGMRAIARHLGWGRHTVQRYAHAKTWQELVDGRWQAPCASMLDPFKLICTSV